MAAEARRSSPRAVISSSRRFVVASASGAEASKIRASSNASCSVSARVEIASTKIGYPEVRRGLVAAVVMRDLVARVGAGRARNLLLTGEAIHAEQNALLQCRDVYLIDTCFVTCSPCMTCTKLLLNTGCRKICFSEVYTGSVEAEKLWLSSGRTWICP